MLLVVTNRDDLTADWLVVELNARQARFERFNTEDYPCDVSVQWTPNRSALLGLPGTNVDLGDVTSVWYRRPLAPRAPDDVDAELAEWAVRESQEALDGIWRTLNASWVNHPDANQSAGCKPEQLDRAARMGLAIPPTLVTNDAKQLRDFAASIGPKLVCKPLYEGWIPLSAGDLGFWTSPFSVVDDDALAELSGEPYLFQALVEKSYDVRVTIIGSNAYAVGIDSQVSPDSSVDWRRGDVDRLDHWIEELPDEVSRRCIELVAGYGLLFGAIDLARRPDGTYVFFELNPNGQWAWLEHRTGLPLRARLADLLVGPA